MSGHPSSQTVETRELRPIPSEAGLLELFAPSNSGEKADALVSRSKHASLWRADAIHRAKNMAQLTASLAVLAEHPSRRWLSTEVAAQVRSLSRAYDVLAHTSDDQFLPCAPLLTEVVTRLVHVFGRVQGVKIMVTIQPVFLSAEARRALVLLASELVVNALKYGYPQGRSGTISVHLAADGDQLELQVDDDGAGPVEGPAVGQGSCLLAQLAGVLSAVLVRTTRPDGSGFRVSASMQISSAANARE